MRLLRHSLLTWMALVLLPGVAGAQGTRTATFPNAWSPASTVFDETGARMPGAHLASARLSGGAQGALIGMGIGAAAGAALALATCGPRTEVPCAPLAAVTAAVGLGLGALVGYSIGREDWD